MELDARNLLCPMPVIKAQDAVEHLATGTQLTIYCTDPGALYDIPAWCRMHGHSVLSTAQEGREVTIKIEVNHSENS